MSAAAGSPSSSPDTAQVGTLVNKQAGEYWKRYDRLKGEVRERIAAGALETPSGRAEFFWWFRDRQAELLVATVGGAIATHYTHRYADSAFASGWRGGALALSDVRRSVDAPRSMDAVEEQISRSTPGVRKRRESIRGNQRVQLANLSRDVEDEVAAVVRESLEEGRGRRATATAINKRVDKVGVARARLIADYELSDAYNRGAAERYRTRGVFEVTVINPSPCPEICAEKVGQTYPIGDAVRGDLCPFHPRCRGFVAPA